jgi:3',5'-cyclic AMP phosphodiesterase CpdA
MKIAHFSDLHLLDLTGVPFTRFLNKRLTGWVNLRLKRGSIHRAAYVEAIARAIAAERFDHVVVTGDLTNLALESEFERVRSLLADTLGMDPGQVTVVPGNHDLYTRGARDSRRFDAFMGPWLKSDLPALAADVSGARFPVVKLRGPVAFIGLSSAVPRLPLVAAGELGDAQLAALRDVLAHPEVKRRTPVIAVHHPPVHPWSRTKAHVEGLRDARHLVALLAMQSRGMVLHGHLHRRIQRDLSTSTGTVRQVGATSASLFHADADRMAGFNVYELGDSDGEPRLRVEAFVYHPDEGGERAGQSGFARTSVPKHVGWKGDQLAALAAPF